MVFCILANSLLYLYVVYPSFRSSIIQTYFIIRYELDHILHSGAEVSCSVDPVREDAPNIIIIMIDTLRIDHLSCMGYERETSSNICSLGEDAVFFPNMISNAPTTKEAVASLFTSKYPSQHRVVRLNSYLSVEHMTLAELLKSAGYRTIGVNANFVVSKYFGFDQGFDVWADHHYMIASGLNEIVTRDLDGSEPFFMYIHYLDPHLPYAPPGEYYTHFNPSYSGAVTGRESILKQHIMERFLNNPEDIQPLTDYYDNEIYYADVMVGQLIDGLKSRGLYDNSIIILLSDHGEHFGEQDRFYHGNGVYSSVIRVPLIIRDPVGPKNIEVSSAVQTIDVMPTILGMIGYKCDHGFAGDDIFEIMDEEDRPIFSEHLSLMTEFNPARSLRLGNYLLIKDLPSGEYSLHDVNKDPLEREDVYVTDNSSERLVSIMNSFEEGLSPSMISDGETVELDEGAEEELRALGYVY
ncbi:sulfatase [Candidatus Altiarchaeota archaeon]